MQSKKQQHQQQQWKDKCSENREMCKTKSQKKVSFSSKLKWAATVSALQGLLLAYHLSSHRPAFQNTRQHKTNEMKWKLVLRATSITLLSLLNKRRLIFRNITSLVSPLAESCRVMKQHTALLYKTAEIDGENKWNKNKKWAFYGFVMHSCVRLFKFTFSPLLCLVLELSDLFQEHEQEIK